MMIKTPTCTVTLALLAMAVITPVNALLRGSPPQADDSSAKAEAATAIDRFQTLIAKKAPWGIYDAAHWSAADATLPEGSRNGKDVISEGTIKHGSGAGHGAKGDVSFIFGSTQSRLYWPEDSIPEAFTICSITRYTGGAERRILQATDLNWVHGHWDSGHIGVAYYDYWNTPAGPAEDETNWAVVCGSNGLPTPNNILHDGVPVGIRTSAKSPGNLAVNPTMGPGVHDLSDWALSFAAIWDQHLKAEEMQTASDALMEYLATGRHILEAPATPPLAAAATAASSPCTMASNVTSITTTTSEGSTATTTITNIPCPEEST